MSRRRAAQAAAAVVALAAAGCGQGAPKQAAVTTVAPVVAPPAHGTPVPKGTTASDFALRDANGSVVRLSAERGRFVLLTFLYTDCPDVCPLIASNLNDVLQSRAGRRSDVSVIAVSVDPAHDTARAVRRYVSEHHLVPQFHYLIGSKVDLTPIWQAYNLLIEVQNVERVSHTAYTLLIDPKGTPRFYYPPTVRAAAIERDLRRLASASRA